MQRFTPWILRGFAGAAFILAALVGANAQTHYRFAHDQQLNSGYSVAYDIFSAKLKQLSGGQMLVDQYPGAQLGQEPQLELELPRVPDLLEQRRALEELREDHRHEVGFATREAPNLVEHCRRETAGFLVHLE